MWWSIAIVTFTACIVLASSQSISEKCPNFPTVGLGVTTGDGSPLRLAEQRQTIAKEIRDGLYWATDGGYDNMFLVGDSGVILVDAPPNLMTRTPNLVQAIRNVTDKPITHLVLTHFHKDHIGAGQQVIEEAGGKVTVVAHKDTVKLLQEAREDDPNDPRPTVTVSFQNKAVVFPNGVIAVDSNADLPRDFKGLILTAGHFHSEGDLFVYAPYHKTLNAVDLIFPGYAPFSRFALTRDIRQFIKAHDTVLSFDFDTLVAGHIDRLGTRRDVETQREYVLGVRQSVMEALAGVDIESIEMDECLALNAFWRGAEFFKRVIEKCAERVKKEWDGKLVIVDEYVKSHCDVVGVSLQLD